MIRSLKIKSRNLLLSAAICHIVLIASCSPSQNGERYLITKTKSEIGQLSTALRVYQGTYSGKPPFTSTNEIDVQDNRLLVSILSANRSNGMAEIRNPQHEAFLHQYFAQKNPSLRDAWGNQLHVLFSTNGSRTVQVGKLWVSELFAIWSDGPNKANDYGEGDDICSWK